jgi:5-aminopentanamidase
MVMKAGMVNIWPPYTHVPETRCCGLSWIAFMGCRLTVFTTLMIQWGNVLTSKNDADISFFMKVAAYQAPLSATSSMKIIERLREQVIWCDQKGIEILCFPEGVLGGLADYARRPFNIAINVADGQLQRLLAPLASDRVAIIVGFTELGQEGRLYNSAAVFHHGLVIGVYRKLHPAINKSIYAAGNELPVFTVGSLTFGIIICNDSNYEEPARSLAARGATALFVPTNNGLPPMKAGPKLVTQTRRVDMARAVDNRVFVIRADVTGRTENLVAYGSSGIVAPDGRVLQSARQLSPDIIVAEIATEPRKTTNNYP